MNVVEIFNSLREKQSHGSERILYNPRNAYLHIRQILNISVDINRKLNQNVLLVLKLDIFSTADAGTRQGKVNYCLLAVFLRERTDIFGNEQILLETKRYSWIDLGTTRTKLEPKKLLLATTKMPYTFERSGCSIFQAASWRFLGYRGRGKGQIRFHTR